jgi:hypothetical protein
MPLIRHIPFFSLKLMLCGFLIYAPATRAGTEEDLALAKSFLKERLRQLALHYPFQAWEKQLSKCEFDLDQARSQNSNFDAPFDPKKLGQIASLDSQVHALIKLRTETNILMRELYAASLVSFIDEKFSQVGHPWDPEAKLTFQSVLWKYEAGSLKPKSTFLAKTAALERDFHSWQSDLQFAFAKDYLSHRVEEILQSFSLAKIEGLYEDYTLQLDYWSQDLNSNPIQNQEQLSILSTKFEENKNWLRQNLASILEVLNTDMLFSDLLEFAAKQKVAFTLEVEEKIESSLKEQNQITLAPIQERIQLWKVFAANLRAKKILVDEQVLKQEHLAITKAEDQKKENQRLEEIQVAQQKAEEERKAKFKETLTALRTFAFKTETSVAIDGDAEKALSTKAGILKTSYVSSGSKKIKVEKEKFSDTLAMVQKFKVEAGQLDFSKMTLQERSNQSAYTYVSPNGRTCQSDLDNFVSEVAMGSFSSFYTFLSYVTPPNWKVGGSFPWKAERGAEKLALDREFSYVDLVVDAHHKRSGNRSKQTETSVNLPANMVVILDPQGAVKRFQSFAEINQVIFKSSDLVDGKVYYKFLNYSTDRQHIYLNGIDGEVKVATLAGKS